MTREEEIALQEEYIKNHPGHRASRPKAKSKPCTPTKRISAKAQEPEKAERCSLYATLRKKRRDLIKNVTRQEMLFKDMLDALGIKSEFQKIFIIKKKGRIIDFFLKNYKMIIEINHTDKQDELKTKTLLRSGTVDRILRFDNQEVEAMNTKDLSKILTLKICPFAESLMDLS